MKSILLSIKPKWIAKILNGKKTIEVRKRFPKEYKGWVYIYCTKTFTKWKGARGYRKDLMINGYIANGKVVARFYCDNVKEIHQNYQIELGSWRYYENEEVIEELACLDNGDLQDYLDMKTGYAIHISQLEIFDKPKELDKFFVEKTTIPDELCEYCLNFSTPCKKCKSDYPLTKAPQNYCYVEVEE